MAHEAKAGAYVCRCEEVDVAAIARAINEGATTINDVKRRTRAAMGICQGIFCTRAIAEMIHATGIPLEEIEPMTARPPARLMTVGDLAGLDE
jgi:NAD(P)H-nitrite reductase large subunit